MTTPTNNQVAQLPEETNQSDSLKLLLEKFAIATARFIKSEITSEQREKVYSEVYLGIKQLESQRERIVREEIVAVVNDFSESTHAETEYEKGAQSATRLFKKYVLKALQNEQKETKGQNV